MKHADFTIGTEFQTCTGQRWRCTDVGRRTIVAMELQPDLEKAWYAGPPFVLPEVVFNELRMARAYRSQEEATLDAMREVDRGLHPGYSNAAMGQMSRTWLSEDSRRYPRRGLLKIDRVDRTGEILHPFAAAWSNGWQIQVYLPFTEEFGQMPEGDFIQFKPATGADLRRRRRRHSRRTP